HTDNTGDFAHNMKLSKDRAAAVVSYLVSKGISQSRLNADGVGPLCPVTTNKDEEGRKKNRRVEIVLK
ncbi:MAG: OmpA family protein, partial [Flavobacteriales bacterium]|nr:OmpA family protein [Flavobacteriales bacterium]